MKHLARIFAALGFAFQFIIPVALLSTIAALTKGETKAGLSAVGTIGLCVIVIALLGKLKDKIYLMKNQAVKQAFLSVSPVVVWVAVYLGIRYFSATVGDLTSYWLKVAPCIVLGRVLYILSGIFKNEQAERDEIKKENSIIERAKANG